MFTRIFKKYETPVKKTDHQLFMEELFNGKEQTKKDNYKSIFQFDSINQYKSIHTYDSLHKTSPSSIEMRQPNAIETFFYYAIIGFFYVLMVVSLPFSLLVCLKKIKENERLVVYRLGRIKSPEYKPGYCICFPLIDSYKRIATSQKEFSLPNLQILNQENDIIDTTTVMRYEIVDAIKLLNSLEDLNGALKSVARGILVGLISKKDSTLIEKEKNYILQDITNEMNAYIKKWGVKITNIEMKINSIQHDQQSEGEDPALKTISMVFKSLLGGSSSSSSSADPNAPKPDTSLTNLPNELMKFIEGLSTPMVIPNDSNMAQTMFPFMNMNSSSEPQAETAINMESNGDVMKMSPFKILKMLEPLINESMVKEIQTVYEFHINSKSKEVEVFYLDLKNMQKGKIGPGHAPFSKTDCVIRISDDDLNELLMDKLKPFTAYMSGRIEIDGDLQDVFKLKKLITSVSKVISAMK